MVAAPVIRRQLSLFLPQPQGALVDAVRARFDPHQHSIIPAHVTLCRDEEAEALIRRGALDLPSPVAIDLAFGEAMRRDDGCVLLPVAGSTASFDALRQRLLGPDCRAQSPHITLMHPRNVVSTPEDLAQIRALPLPAGVRLSEIVLIEQIDGGTWHVIQRY